MHDFRVQISLLSSMFYGGGRSSGSASTGARRSMRTSSLPPPRAARSGSVQVSQHPARVIQYWALPRRPLPGDGWPLRWSLGVEQDRGALTRSRRHPTPLKLAGSAIKQPARGFVSASFPPPRERDTRKRSHMMKGNTKQKSSAKRPEPASIRGGGCLTDRTSGEVPVGDHPDRACRSTDV